MSKKAIRKKKPDTTSGRGLLDKKQAALRCSFNVRTLDRWVKAGLLPYVDFGNGERRFVRFREEDLDAFIESRLVRGTDETPTPAPAPVRKRRAPGSAAPITREELFGGK